MSVRFEDGVWHGNSSKSYRGPLGWEFNRVDRVAAVRPGALSGDFFRGRILLIKWVVKKVTKWTNRPFCHLFPAGAGSPADRARASWQGCPVATWRCSFR